MSQATPPARPEKPAPQAQPAPAPRRDSILRRLPERSGLLFALAAVIIALGVGLQLLWPAGFPLEAAGAAKGAAEIHSSGPIRINELMGKNDSTLADENGLTPDWIEVANVGSSPVELYGYALARDARSANVYRFPDLTLAAGECVIVYADSTVGESAAHAPFNLSSQGGTLMLFNRKGTEIDSVNYPAMGADTAYVRVDENTWEMRAEATPGRMNTAENYRALRSPNPADGVEITEVLPGNTQYAPDANGTAHDYIELHNTTGADIDLSGWFISDDMARPIKWRLPDGFVIPAGGYRLIYASKLDRADAAEPHAAFGLSSGGEAVVLSDARGALVDAMQYGASTVDTAWIKSDTGDWVLGTPSPGVAN